MPFSFGDTPAEVGAQPSKEKFVFSKDVKEFIPMSPFKFNERIPGPSALISPDFKCFNFGSPVPSGLDSQVEEQQIFLKTPRLSAVSERSAVPLKPASANWGILPLLKTGEFSDFKLFVGRDKIVYNVHRVILSTHSNFFKLLCYKDGNPSAMGQAFLQNQDQGTMDIVLHFLYSGKVIVEDMERAGKVLEAAVDLQIPSLKKAILEDVPSIILGRDGMWGNPHELDQVYTEEKKAALVSFLDKMYTWGGVTDDVKQNLPLQLVTDCLSQFKDREDFQKLLLKHSRLGYEMVFAMAGGNYGQPVGASRYLGVPPLR